MKKISIRLKNGDGHVFSASERGAAVIFSAMGIRIFISGVEVKFSTDIDVWVGFSSVLLAACVEIVVDDVIGAVFWNDICTDVVIGSVIIGIVMSSESPKKLWVNRLNWIWLLRSFT